MKAPHPVRRRISPSHGSRPWEAIREGGSNPPGAVRFVQMPDDVRPTYRPETW